MKYRYVIMGSEDRKEWAVVDVAMTKRDAEVRMGAHRSSNHEYCYYRISERLRCKIPRVIKGIVTWPYIQISKWLSYLQAPVTSTELGQTITGEGLEQITNYLTHANKETRFVVAKMFPVIMRLFNSSGTYKKLIHDSLDYMMEITTRKFKDYPEIKGISGANVGIPFNLVVIKVGRIGDDLPEAFKNSTISYKGYRFFHMINPKIVEESSSVFHPFTNCGSIKLEKQIRVERHKWVSVEYYDRSGNRCVRSIDRPFSGTVQHEIDHNNGMLITDRKWVPKDEGEGEESR